VARGVFMKERHQYFPVAFDRAGWPEARQVLAVRPFVDW
jgi:hypothetical protein